MIQDLLLLPPLLRRRANVLGNAATLAVNEALQAAMFLAKAEFLPDVRTAALDEILAIGIGPESELEG